MDHMYGLPTYVQPHTQVTSESPTRPEPRAGTSPGRAFQGQVDCLAPGYDGFRAAFQKETKRRVDEAQARKVRRWR